MTTMRQRKMKTEDERTSNEIASYPKKNMSRSVRKYFMFASGLCMVFFIYLAITNDLTPMKISSKAVDNIAFTFNLQQSFHIVIIDAGSTGSRVLAFSFHESIINGNWELDHEMYFETKPGLSQFADQPEDAAKSLTILLEKAKSSIPQSEWSRTPLSMKATAGLRLLPTHKANNILEKCKKLFQSSGFQVSNNSISIMEGKDEGIFSWFTVNFLLGRLNSFYPDDTVAALDLGGASTQVTFSPGQTEMKRLQEDIHFINVFNHNMTLYTHSYLGMGLMAARKEILNYQLDKNDQTNVIKIESECINPIVSTEWMYGGKHYLITGMVNGTYKAMKTQDFGTIHEIRKPIVNFSKCLKIIEKFVNDNIGSNLIDLKNRQVYAFSYYFDRATEVGLIDPFSGGVISLDILLKQAIAVCEYPNTDQPFMCLDLTYIYVLLHNGFNLEQTTKLHLYRKINSHELSWALGAAFNILQDGL